MQSRVIVRSNYCAVGGGCITTPGRRRVSLSLAENCKNEHF